MRLACLLLSLLPQSLWAQQGVQVDNDRLLLDAMRIEREVELLRDHFAVAQRQPHRPVDLRLRPRHIWQKGYAIHLQISDFRRRHKLPVTSLMSLEPVANLDPSLVLEQEWRLLAELHILKWRFGVDREIDPPTLPADTASTDETTIFNRLDEVVLRLEELNGLRVDPSLVFAEVMRILADVDGLLQHLRLEDNTFPPEKRADLTPADSLRQAFELMAEIHRLQREVGIPRTDFEAFRKTEEVVPADVFNMVGLALAELQTIKAQRDLRYSMTPPANYYRDKTPADVHQLLSWVTRKLQLIKRL